MYSSKVVNDVLCENNKELTGTTKKIGRGGSPNFN